jgi:hypothetical protein
MVKNKVEDNCKIKKFGAEEGKNYRLCYIMECRWPVSVAARSKAWVYGRSPAVIAGSKKKSSRGSEYVFLIAVCCQVEFSIYDRLIAHPE